MYWRPFPIYPISRGKSNYRPLVLFPLGAPSLRRIPLVIPLPPPLPLHIAVEGEYLIPEILIEGPRAPPYLLRAHAKFATFRAALKTLGAGEKTLPTQ